MSLLDETLQKIMAPDAGARHRARARLERLTMPRWALGRLMDLAEDLAGMTRSLRPLVGRKVIVVMAGDHGVTAEGVSSYPSEVTLQMVHNFVRGGAGINALARQAGARVQVVDLGVYGDLDGLDGSDTFLSRKIAPGTGNIVRGPAMTMEQARQSVEEGIRVSLELGPDTDVFGTGEMGIGNTTPSSAVAAVLTGAPVSWVTGRGTGIDDGQYLNKINIIERALEVNRPDKHDPLDVLAKVGGFEIGGIAGLILGAAALQKPVVFDGFISTAGALIAGELSPSSCGYMIAAHRSVEKGHSVALDHLGKKPLLDLGLRLGEGTGAALAMNLVEAAARILTDVATFEEASVSQAVKP